MRLDFGQSLLTVLAVAAVTFLTRLLPFAVFGRKRKAPAFISYLGGFLPYAIMGMLVVYCLRGVQVFQYPYGLPEALSVLAVIALHKWRHNMLLSIACGTVLYMVLVQMVFA